MTGCDLYHAAGVLNHTRYCSNIAVAASRAATWYKYNKGKHDVITKLEVGYTTYHNAVRSGPSHIHKTGEVWLCRFPGLRMDRQTYSSQDFAPLKGKVRTVSNCVQQGSISTRVNSSMFTRGQHVRVSLLLARGRHCYAGLFCAFLCCDDPSTTAT